MAQARAGYGWVQAHCQSGNKMWPTVATFTHAQYVTSPGEIGIKN